jgi:GTP-binding protein
VDLPGYGYARCSKAERDKWAALINKYLRGNARLFGVVALLDSRLTPQVLDIDLITFIRAQGIEVFPVMTKADKCKQPVRSANQAAWQRLLGSEKPPLLTSSHSGMNIDKLWQFFLDKFAATQPHE